MTIDPHHVGLLYNGMYGPVVHINRCLFSPLAQESYPHLLQLQRSKEHRRQSWLAIYLHVMYKMPSSWEARFFPFTHSSNLYPYDLTVWYQLKLLPNSTSVPPSLSFTRISKLQFLPFYHSYIILAFLRSLSTHTSFFTDLNSFF